ncbi:MAG: DMT family transporter [Elusimicrobiota bacterium]|jgi:drug/metabolite transporter (DMT)-like permease|nr:DMT family transporter [Elusimicrobiota bacterium]
MDTFRGFLYAVLANITFGLIPLFTLPLYAAGLDFIVILTYRFLPAAAVLLLAMLFKKVSFRLRKGEFGLLLFLSVLYNGTAYFLFCSYKYLASGVTTALQMIYPIMVMFIAMFVFKEPRRKSMFVAAAMALLGVAFFSFGEYAQGANLFGVLLSLLAATLYAIYIVCINHSQLKYINSVKMIFYVMLLSGVFFAALALSGRETLALPDVKSGVNVLLLAVLSTAVPALSLTKAIKKAGSIITSLMGCLSPATAIIVGILVFGERFTQTIATGMAFVFTSLLIVIFSNGIDGHIKGVINRMVGHLGFRLR